jgi:hypothetical protein
MSQKVGKRMDPKNGINGNGWIRFGKTENGMDEARRLKTDGSKNGSMAKQMDPLGIMKNGMDEEG